MAFLLRRRAWKQETKIKKMRKTVLFTLTLVLTCYASVMAESLIVDVAKDGTTTFDATNAGANLRNNWSSFGNGNPNPSKGSTDEPKHYLEQYQNVTGSAG